MEQQLKELCIKCEEGSNLEECLGKYTKPKLKQILDIYGVKMPSAAKKQEMTEKAEETVKSNVISFFSGEGAELLNDMKALCEEAKTVSSEAEFEGLKTLYERGFIYLAANGDAAVTVVPGNIKAILGAMETEYPEIEVIEEAVPVERTETDEEIIKYTRALANIYGVYQANQLKEVWDFNHKRGISPNELRRAIEKSCDADGFYISDSYIVSNTLKNIEEYVKVIASLERTDTYFYPLEDVIEEYADAPVMKPEPEYYFLESYIAGKLGSDEAAEEFISKLFMLCVRDAVEEEVLDFVKTNGISFDNEEDKERFLYLYTCWFYELRIWSCKGYKPAELRIERFAYRNFKHKEGVDPKAIKRVERNDECPCGSGKKFKKCCMKKF